MAKDNNKKPTITDIASHANVSKSTVSRVLNGTTPVHEDKRKAVEVAMKEMNFEPNVFARGLASGQSLTIGVAAFIAGVGLMYLVMRRTYERRKDSES